MEILINKHFTRTENAIKDVREISVHMATVERDYIYRKGISKVYTDIVPFLADKQWKEYIIGKSWIILLVNEEDEEDTQLFIVVCDEEDGWYASHLHIGMFRKKGFEQYRRAKGFDVVTDETRMIQSIVGEFGLFYKTDKIYDSRYKMVDKKQRIKYTNTKTRRDFDYFYEEIVGIDKPKKYRNEFYPDVTLKRKVGKEERTEYIEYENSQYEKSKFFIKLFKLQSTKRRIYFIFNPKYKNTHISYIKQFHQFRKLNSIFYCTTDEFIQRGALAMRRLKL